MMTDDERLVKLVQRVQNRHPDECAKLGEPLLLSMARHAMAVCPGLHITEDRDMTRFLALSVLLTPEQRRSKLVEGVVRRVLAHVEWEAKKRLDFLHKHLVARPVSPNEIDFGPTFTAPPSPASGGDLS